MGLCFASVDNKVEWRSNLTDIAFVIYMGPVAVYIIRLCQSNKTKRKLTSLRNMDVSSRAALSFEEPDSVVVT